MGGFQNITSGCLGFWRGLNLKKILVLLRGLSSTTTGTSYFPEGGLSVTGITKTVSQRTTIKSKSSNHTV